MGYPMRVAMLVGWQSVIQDIHKRGKNTQDEVCGLEYLYSGLILFQFVPTEEMC
jgi:hypothetical protein